MEIVLTWRELLVAVLLATLIYLMEVALFSRRRRSQAGQDGDAGFETRLVRLEQELAGLRARVEQIEAQAAGHRGTKAPEDTPYARAMRLAMEGLPASELASRCGISRAEAELIIALQRGEGK